MIAMGLASAVESPVIPGVKMTTPPTIDGVINTETEWAGAAKGSGEFHDSPGLQISDVQTQFWIGYDDKYIYFAARMHDPNPKGIKANAYQTNVSLTGDDWVRIGLDPIGKLVDFSTFAMNPKGATAVYICGGRAAKREWRGDFIAKSRITEDGWETESRIPWNIMNLPSPGKRTLRFNVIRYRAQSDRTSLYEKRTDDLEQNVKWLDVEVPKADTSRVLNLLPFGYLGAIEGQNPIFDGGLDLKTAITQKIDVVGSIKPDFRNVENQILSLDFSHYERIAGESRPFFGQGSEYYNPFNSIQFISQRIPDFDVGLKSFGKLNDKTSFGILDTNTLGEQNSFVSVFSYNPIPTAQFSFVGTSLNTPTRSNQTSGLYYGQRRGNYAWDGTLIGSDDKDRNSGYYKNASVSYGCKGWGILASFTNTEKAFYPALGYIQEVGMEGAGLDLNYYGLVQRGGVQSTSAYVSASNYQNLDGTHYRSSLYAQSLLTWKSGFTAVVSGNFQRFLGIDEHLYSVNLMESLSDQYRNWSVGASWGDQYGAYYVTPTCSASYRPLRNLQMNLSYQYIDFYGTSDQSILTANYDLGRDFDISTRIVKRDENWNAYLSFRRSGNRGTEYYLILGDPNSLTIKASVILKVTVPLPIKY
jgi:hypothetical protein